MSLETATTDSPTTIDSPTNTDSPKNTAPAAPAPPSAAVLPSAPAPHAVSGPGRDGSARRAASGHYDGLALVPGGARPPVCAAVSAPAPADRHVRSVQPASTQQRVPPRLPDLPPGAAPAPRQDSAGPVDPDAAAEFLEL